MKLRRGDTVLIISGKDRGKIGKIIRSLPREGRIVVEGVNMRKKHTRPRKAGEKGQIITLPAPIDISNVILICSKCGKATRVGYRIDGERKYRICKKCGGET